MNKNDYPLNVSKATGFNETGPTQVLVKAYKSNGDKITLLGGGAYTITVGSGASGTGPGTGTGAGAGVNTPPNCSGTNPDPAKCFINPLPVDELTATFLLIAKGFLSIVAIWGVIFIIVGGFRMVAAAGNEEAYAAAKKTITWAVLGVVIASLSFSIIAIVENLLRADVPKVLF